MLKHFISNMKTVGIFTPQVAKLIFKFRHIPIKKIDNPDRAYIALTDFWEPQAIGLGYLGDKEKVTALLHELGHVLDIHNLKNEPRSMHLYFFGQWSMLKNQELRAWKNAFKLAKEFNLEVDIDIAKSWYLTYPTATGDELVTEKIAA